MAQQLVKPTIPVRVMYHLGFYVKGFVDCPIHGWTYDPESHGYHSGMMFHRCQAEECDFTVEFL